MRRANVALGAILAAVILFAILVPFIYGPIENACRNPTFPVYCTAQGYESLVYHLLGFGAVMVHSSYYFWTTR